MANKAPRKVAIVHDWLYGGGAERVVLELHRMYPEAPIYTSYCSPEWRAKLDNKVVTGYLQRWPFSSLRKVLPVLRIRWFESLDLSAYDLVISSSGNGEAKGVKAGSKFKVGQVHICYCHSPTHFYWRHYDQYLKQPGFGSLNPLIRLALRILVGPLRTWDLKAAQRPDIMIANSSHIQKDIKKYYGRDSDVIWPPVDIDRFQTSKPKQRQSFVAVGRQVPYKRTDIIVKACNKLGLPLTVVGNGPENNRLKSLAGPTITFVDDADDNQVAEAMASAKAFIFAAHEDFGITPIEALAAGTPLIAYRAGGALDYLKPGVNGEFFERQTVDSLSATLKNFDATRYQTDKIQATAQDFSAEKFTDRMRRLFG